MVFKKRDGASHNMSKVPSLFVFTFPRAPIIIGGMGLLYDLLSKYM